MAPTTLAPGFSLRDGTPSELEEIFDLTHRASTKDPLYRLSKGEVTSEGMVKWLVDTLGERYKAPDMATYVIVEDATGKIVAWTGLQFPWKYRPLNEEQKAKFTSHDMPPLEREMNKDAMTEFFTALECTKAYGYDAENDYHRKGTMVDPDFQKRGFGTVLTRYANAIMDKTGDRTFVPARPTSQKMFEDNGFKVLGYHDSRLERWNEDMAWTNTAILVRDPPS